MGIATGFVDAAATSARSPAPSFPTAKAQDSPGRNERTSSPAGSAARISMRRSSSHGLASAHIARTMRIWKPAPAAARTAFGFHGSTEPSRTITASTPKARAARMRVPRLPGSCRPSNSNTVAGLWLPSPARSRLGSAHTHRMPCGCSVSESSARSASSTSAVSGPRTANAEATARPASVSSNPGERTTKRMSVPAANTSADDRTPSTSTSPSRGRPLRVLSRAMSCRLFLLSIRIPISAWTPWITHLP